MVQGYIWHMVRDNLLVPQIVILVVFVEFYFISSPIITSLLRDNVLVNSYLINYLFNTISMCIF